MREPPDLPGEPPSPLGHEAKRVEQFPPYLHTRNLPEASVSFGPPSRRPGIQTKPAPDPPRSVKMGRSMSRSKSGSSSRSSSTAFSFLDALTRAAT